MKKYLNVMIDTETLSRRPNAAIIQIAAVPFNMDGSRATTKTGGPLSAFDEYVDATTCAMYGMDFNMETVEWWAKNFPANDCFKYKIYGEPLAIHVVLDKFVAALSDWLQTSDADELKVWSQGTDFDIALLREAFRIVKGSDLDIPWKYRNVRDARTYFLEAAAIFAPDEADPYSLINTDGVKHDALADCNWSINAVQWAYEKYTQRPVGLICDREDYRLATGQEVKKFHELLHKLHKEWDAEKKEIVKWEFFPTLGQKFYYVSWTGNVESAYYRVHTDFEASCFGNCFETEEEAAAAAVRVKKALKGE